MNVLKPHLRMSVETLLARGVGLREIARRLDIDRGTVRRIAATLEAKTPGVATDGQAVADSKSRPLATDFGDGVAANAPTPATGCEGAGAEQTGPGWPPTSRASMSACEPHREWIEDQVRLGRNAMSIYRELVDRHSFGNHYNSVKRFVGGLKQADPERFDVLEFPPGEEAQVDYGQGAPTLAPNGKYKKPYLFVMTLKYSGKSFRKVTWKTSQGIWAQLHEEAFRSFGGCPGYVVLDNLKEGVIKPDLYEPRLNPVYAAFLAHYNVIADPCRVRDPNRKGTVENAIQHTQGELKGRRFESIDDQNGHLQHWEDRWASTRIHGRKKRQVMEMFLEEKPHLKPLPVDAFRLFTQGFRTVDDAGLVQVDGAYYSALPANPHSRVMVRVFDADIEIFSLMGALLRRHGKAARKGAFVMARGDRLFNPSRETTRILNKIDEIGPETAALAQAIFARDGRAAHRTIYGLSNLARTYPCADIEAVCKEALADGTASYSAIRQGLERRAARASTPPLSLRQSDPQIRPITDYQAFWDAHTLNKDEDSSNDHVIH